MSDVFSDFPEQLGAALPPGPPAGEDLAFAPELDDLRAARQGDDPGLAQGPWVRPVRTPQWTQVRERCEAILRSRSLDLRVAGWYAEALTRIDGFRGLAVGLRTVDRLLDRFWDHCHPALDRTAPDGRDAEERAGKLEWLNLNVTAAARQIPLTSPESGGHSWLQWHGSLAVDNLALRDPQAKDAAAREGKLAGEAWHKAVAASGPEHFQRLLDRIREAEAACRSLGATVRERFPHDPPSLEDLVQAIRECRDLAGRSLTRFEPAAGNPVAPAQNPTTAPPPLPPPAPPPCAAPIRDRGEAIQGLRGIAGYFRAAEPHSPVAPLVERAAKWAEMPLGQWLGSVIKDPATLDGLKELLDLEP